MSQSSNQNIGHAAAGEPKVTSSHLVEQLARAALKNVPGSEAVLNKHFNKGLIKPEIKTKKIENLVMHSGYEFGR